MSSSAPRRVGFRRIEDSDREFLCRLYASTREEELSVLDWSEEQKKVFLDQQFEAQHTFYQDTFKAATLDVILVDGKPAGRLYVDRRKDEIRLIDIALMPEHRGQGLGASLMQDVLAEGSERGLPVRIHVERNNPALRLYHRLGFTEVEDQGVYFLMEWRPLGAAPKGSTEEPS